MGRNILVQGIFVADLAFWTKSIPQKGETFIGEKFHVNPGGKGSNQAVAANRAGGNVTLLTKLGRDEFGKMAKEFYAEEGIHTDLLFETDNVGTGAAAINILESTGENSIIVVPGAGAELTNEEIEQAKNFMRAGDIFLTQFETPIERSIYGLKTAKEAGMRTILNPAPASSFPNNAYPYIDFITPNEVEAEQLCGRKVESEADANWAADWFLDRGVHTAVLTLGERGAFVKNREICELLPAFSVGRAIDTTGAGDAFNGGFAVALAEDKSILDAVRFGNATAGISVTRVGTAKSTPSRTEIDALLA